MAVKSLPTSHDITSQKKVVKNIVVRYYYIIRATHLIIENNNIFSTFN